MWNPGGGAERVNSAASDYSGNKPTAWGNQYKAWKPPGLERPAVSTAAAPAPPAPEHTIAVDTAQRLRVWDGIGGLSAGASSRLLYDYEPSIRSDILDMLFTPRLGWAYQILKIETGGDCQSTWGTEPSYAHTADDIGWDRGYEWWLAKEAKARNPKIALASLSWCVPGWIEDGGLSPAD
eukprot:COSAG04_NODE_13354_length_609_cov_1.398039_1_plen_179_part_01